MATESGSTPNGSRHVHGWTFLSNHAHVLVCLSRDPDLTMREVAQLVGITERAVQNIVADLSRDGYLRIEHRGRNNHYVLNGQMPLRHPLEADASTATLLAALRDAAHP